MQAIVLGSAFLWLCLRDDFVHSLPAYIDCFDPESSDYLCGGNSNQQCSNNAYGPQSCCTREGAAFGSGGLDSCCNHAALCSNGCADGKCPTGPAQVGVACSWDAGCFSNRCKVRNGTAKCECMPVFCNWEASLLVQRQCNPAHVALHPDSCCDGAICSKSAAVPSLNLCCLPTAAPCSPSNKKQCCSGRCVNSKCGTSVAGGPCLQTADCDTTLSLVCNPSTKQCEPCASLGETCGASLKACCSSYNCVNTKCCKPNGDSCSQPSVCCGGACQANLCKSILNNPCAASGDCVAGLTCDGGACKAQLNGQCAQSSDCATGLTCEGGSCKSSLNGQCAQSSDCVTGLTCTGGTCKSQSPLNGQCAQSSDCITGLTCQAGSCKAQLNGQCAQTSDCVTGLSCEAGSYDGLHRWTAPKSENLEPPFGDRNTLGTRIVGSFIGKRPCAQTADCDAGFTCEGGTCKSNLNGQCSQASDCVSGLTCEAGKCKSPLSGQCAAHTDCVVGLSCRNGICSACVATGSNCCQKSDCHTGVCLAGQCHFIQSKGCMEDCLQPQLLSGYTFQDAALTIEMCQFACFTGQGKGNGLRYRYAGVEGSNKCFCGNELNPASAQFGTPRDSFACDAACAGNSDQICGGDCLMNVYYDQGKEGIYIKPLHCARDTNVLATRQLQPHSFSDTAMTVFKCLGFCWFLGPPADFKERTNYAGVENGNECYCGNVLADANAATNCDIPCNGNAGEICGGSLALSLYELATIDGLWKNLYCSDAADATLGKVLSEATTVSTSLTVESCKTWCRSRGFILAGLKSGTECNCGNSLAFLREAPNQCTTPCSGDANQQCGGTLSTSLFVYTVRNEPVWTAPVCDAITGTNHITITSTTLTQSLCRWYCFANGRKFAATTHGNECHCYSTISLACTTPSCGSPASCSQACSGAPSETCGGAVGSCACGATDSAVFTYQSDTTNN